MAVPAALCRALPADELAVATAQLSDLDPATVRRELRDDPAGFAVTAAHAARTLSTPESGNTGGLVLMVDQFEQVFTQCPDPTQRHRFITALHAAATTQHADTTVLVVLVVRADFETRCSDYEELVEAIQHHYLVTAMTERQLRMAITEPAKQAGSRVDAALADQLLREVRTYITDSTARVTERSVAGVLPLLSYALDRTWRLRAGDPVTMRDYERSGGLEGAVVDSAHRAYTSLTPPQQDLARRVFTRLVISGSDGTDTTVTTCPGKESTTATSMRCWRLSPTNACSLSAATPSRSATRCCCRHGHCCAPPGWPRPVRTEPCARGCGPRQPNGNVMIAIRRTCIRAACSTPPPPPQITSPPTPPATHP